MWIGTAAFVVATVSVSAADAPMVTITGGANQADRGYAWTISHQHTSPLTFVAFPHYRASLFQAPEGWSTESTFLVNVGVADQPGVCTSEAASPAAQITAGEPAMFRMQVVRERAAPAVGTVLVRFADGREMRVPNVQLPARESVGDKYVALIGLGAIFLMWLVFRSVRRWRSRRATTSASVA